MSAKGMGRVIHAIATMAVAARQTRMPIPKVPNDGGVDCPKLKGYRQRNIGK